MNGDLIWLFPSLPSAPQLAVLRPYRNFWQLCREKLGAAFVVILHLDPDYKSLLSELLTKKTAMTVLQIEDGMQAEPDHVYVIPPNTTLRIEDDRFKLAPRAGERPHHPADVFFSSLAESRGDAAVGIVLSGGDSDGSLGIRSIKESGGITFAQQPESARVSSMPRNAIETGCVDFVLRPSGIAHELTRLGKHSYLKEAGNGAISEDLDSQSETERGLRWIFRKLRSAHGVDFSHYKRSTLLRRLSRRMAVRRVDGLPEYRKLLEDEAAEAAALYQDFLIRVTNFFRDPQLFEALDLRVFPLLCEERSAKNPLRLWVPGCATGEEVYSLAIALLEYLGDRYAPSSIQLFGTDVSETAIEKARAGIYLANIAEDLSGERLHRYFTKLDGHYQISKSIRDMCIFARQDVTRDPPFSRIDLVSCRNLLIYLDSAAQRAVMQVFHYALRAQGFLILGQSESIGSASELFDTIDKQQRIYTRRVLARADLLARSERATLPKSIGPGDPVLADETIAQFESAQREADRMLLALYAPASILVDEHLNILQFRGETGPYMEHASGAPSFNVHRVVRAEILIALSPAIAEARESGRTSIREGLSVDERTDLTLRVIPLKASNLDNCYLVLFEDATRRPAAKRNPQPTHASLSESEKDRRLLQLERDLAATRDYLQSTIEEHEAVKEELKSAHEEVLSANEEFQSTNEELETSKEELQSSNEELITMNDELRDRNRELAVLNSELKRTQALSARAQAYADSICEHREGTPFGIG